MDFRQFLEMKYLEWQRDSGGRKTVNDFARYIGVSPSTISMWWSGERSPQGENIVKLSFKLGLEVYDVLGLPRPDPELHYIQQHWDVYSPEERRALLEQAKTFRRE